MMQLPCWGHYNWGSRSLDGATVALNAESCRGVEEKEKTKGQQQNSIDYYHKEEKSQRRNASKLCFTYENGRG